MDTKIIDFNKFKCMENYCISDIPELSDKLKDSYIGIVDAYGLESIQKADSMTLKELAQMIFCLDLRAKANSHRNAVFYIIELNSDVYLKIMEKVQYKDFIGAGIIISSILGKKK
jgi:hypothetical protein